MTHWKLVLAYDGTPYHGWQVQPGLATVQGALSDAVHRTTGERVLPPLGLAHFPQELPMPPRSWVERVFTVDRWTEMARGGHFAAMEAPELLAGEIRDFFRPLRR